MTRFTDSMIMDGRLRKTDDGYVAQARVARGGNVQVYLGAELGLTDRETVRVYRPEEAVFDREAISTYARKPITIGHPRDGVNPETWKDLAVGEIDRDVMRDGEFVSVPLLFRDAKAIALLQSGDGPRELSMGYDAAVVMRDGTTPTGEPYDAVMSGFRMNHVALVDQARGGAQLRIGDGADDGKDRARWGASPITPVSDKKEDLMSDALKTVVLGDNAVRVATDDHAAVEAFKADAAKRLADAEDRHSKEIAAKDAAIAKAEAERDEARAKILSDADLDARVAARADLIAKAKSIVADVKTDGIPDAEIRKAVVLAKLGDAMAEKPAAYIDARFDILAEDAGKSDPLRDRMKDAPPPVGDARAQAEKARRDYIATLADGWKQPVGAVN